MEQDQAEKLADQLALFLQPWNKQHCVSSSAGNYLDMLGINNQKSKCLQFPAGC